MDGAPFYHRILLKLSGEALKGENPSGLCGHTLENIADEIKQVHQIGVQVAIVIGGGNFFRGGRNGGLSIERPRADTMGMLATVMNGIALLDALEKKGLQVRLISALAIQSAAEPFSRERALHHLGKGRVVIFSAGTGNPFFTTDTAAALRAIEINADVLLKATMVDGVYSADPKKENGEKLQKFAQISYADVLTKDLKVIDSTAVILSKENNLHIKVFNITKQGNILKVVKGEDIGTSIKE